MKARRKRKRGLRQRLENIHKGVGNLESRLERMLVTSVSKQWAETVRKTQCHHCEAAGENQTPHEERGRNSSVIVKCDSGCCFVYHISCFDRLLSTPSSCLSVGECTLDTRWFMVGPMLKGRPCPSSLPCSSSSISSSSSSSSHNHNGKLELVALFESECSSFCAGKTMKEDGTTLSPGRFRKWILHPFLTVKRIDEKPVSRIPLTVKYPNAVFKTSADAPATVTPLLADDDEDVDAEFKRSETKCPILTQGCSKKLGGIRDGYHDGSASIGEQARRAAVSSLLLRKLNLTAEVSSQLRQTLEMHGATVMIVGRSGSGKTSLLNELKAKWDFPNSDELRPEEITSSLPASVCPSEVSWNRRKAVISQFSSDLDETGEQNESHAKAEADATSEIQQRKIRYAIRWLSCVGLNSIPEWCKPFHALSTGQRYRVSLARLLSLSCRGGRHHCPSRRRALFLDDFAHTLDPDSQRCVSASFAAFYRRQLSAPHHSQSSSSKPQVPSLTVLATSYSSLGSWIQPHVLILLDGSGSSMNHRLLINPHALTKPKIQLHVNLENLNSERDLKSAAEGSRFESSYHLNFGGWCDGQGFKAADVPSKESKNIAMLTKLASKTSYKEHRGYKATATASNETFQKQVVVYARVVRDMYINSLNSLFDVPFDGVASKKIPGFPSLESLGDFDLGVIIGESGSAKTVMATHYFGHCSKVLWDPKMAIEHHFPDSQVASKALRAVCLPSGLWGANFQKISQSEQHRANLARLLLDGGVCDEFASHFDPNTTQEVCYSLQTYFSNIRLKRAISGSKEFSDRMTKSRRPGLVLVTAQCQLQLKQGVLRPDWIYDTTSLTMYRFQHQPVLRRALKTECAVPRVSGLTSCERLACCVDVPELNLQLEKADAGVWDEVFGRFHYKSGSLSHRATSFVATAPPCLPKGAIPQSGNVTSSKKPLQEGEADAYRAHRTVVLPQWQGMGIGALLSDVCGEIFRRNGKRYFGQTVHPRFGTYRDRSILWKALPWNHTIQKYRYESWAQIKTHTQVRLRQPRKMYAHEYLGPQDAESRKHLITRIQFSQASTSSASSSTSTYS